MDEELKSLEAELQQLRPRQPSVEVRARIETGLAPRCRVAWTWVALPLAAAFAVVAALQFRHAPVKAPEVAPMVAEAPAAAEPPAAEVYKPVAAEKVLYAARDDGVVTLADGTKARRLRSSYVDTITWRNPQTNASLRWSVPRDEVRVVPVNFQ